MPNPLIQHEISIDVAAERVEILTDAGDVPMLWGVPGIGKTDIVHQLGQRRKRPVIEFHAALRETVDLRGIPYADLLTNTTRYLNPDELPRVDRDGEFGYMFCDEINQASPQVMSSLAGLILYGAVGDYRLPKGWRVIAAGNRVADRAAAQRMPSHVKNRLAHLYVTPSVAAWCKWAVANGVPPEVIAFVRFRPELIHRMPADEQINAYPTPRSITKASKYINAPDKHRLGLFASLIGDDVATELNGFLKLYRSIGTLDDIIANPDTAKIPTEGSLRYATFTGLARMANRENFAKVMTYADRLDSEGQTLLVHDATVREPKLKETAAYSNWAVNNQHVTIQ